MQYFRKMVFNQTLLPNELIGAEKTDINSIFDDMLPYCSPQEKQTFTQMRNMYQSFQNMKEMMEMVETIKELFPEGFGGFGNVTDNTDTTGDCNNTNNFGSFSSFNPEMLAALSSMFGGQSMDMNQIADMFQALQGST